MLATDVRSRDYSANETLLAAGFASLSRYQAAEKPETAEKPTPTLSQK